MSTNLPAAADKLHEQLVAYLDGELDAEERAEIERRLSEEPRSRELLTELQRSWDMLDILPQAETPESFTRSTVEMVAVTAAEDESQRRAKRKVTRWLGWLAVAALAVVAALIGYRGNMRQLDARNQALLRDLPLIENVDAYRHIDDIEFLRKLDESGIFAPEVDNAN
jgi:anti-sigma factor RsiW